MSVITVSVTQEDIDKGKPGEPCLCPVARAISRYYENRYLVAVNRSRIVLNDLFEHSARTPDDVQYFVSDFDAECKVEPFSFTLDIDDSGLEIWGLENE
jgi:hypothetical protein